MSKYFLIWLIYAFLQEDPTVPVWREFIHFDGKKLSHVLYSLPKSRNVVVESLKIYLDEVYLFALMLDLRLG